MNEYQSIIDIHQKQFISHTLNKGVAYIFFKELKRTHDKPEPILKSYDTIFALTVYQGIQRCHNLGS